MNNKNLYSKCSYFLEEKKFLLIVVCIYALAAFYSDGYFHPDEHFQILEFSNFKSGLIDSKDLAWEFNLKIRSTFQPWIGFIVIKLLSLINYYSPFTAAFILRLCTSFLAIFAINRFVKLNLEKISINYRCIFILCSYFLWFLPFINVRFSSETWSGLFFLLGLTYLPHSSNRNIWYFLIVGLFFGIAFLCRFQTGIMFVSVLFYLLIILKIEFKECIVLICGFCIIILFGIFLDSLFYNKFTVTSWNYFNINIIQDAASKFGTKNWITYLFEISHSALLPLGIIIFCFLFLFSISNFDSIVFYCVVPFFLVHLFIPHKELRFIFPLVNFIPIIFIKGYEEFCRIYSGRIIRILKLGIGFILIFFNLIALFTSMFYAPEYGRIRVAKKIYNFTDGRPANIYFLEGNNPFQPYSFLNQSFYISKNLNFRTLNNYNMLSDLNCVQLRDSIFFLVVRESEVNNPILMNYIKSLNLTRAFSGNFPIILSTLFYYNENNLYFNYLVYTSND